jgi:hypothetical protein
MIGRDGKIWVSLDLLIKKKRNTYRTENSTAVSQGCCSNYLTLVLIYLYNSSKINNICLQEVINKH